MVNEILPSHVPYESIELLCRAALKDKALIKLSVQVLQAYPEEFDRLIFADKRFPLSLFLNTFWEDKIALFALIIASPSRFQQVFYDLNSLVNYLKKNPVDKKCEDQLLDCLGCENSLETLLKHTGIIPSTITLRKQALTKLIDFVSSKLNSPKSLIQKPWHLLVLRGMFRAQEEYFIHSILSNSLFYQNMILRSNFHFLLSAAIDYKILSRPLLKDKSIEFRELLSTDLLLAFAASYQMPCDKQHLYQLSLYFTADPIMFRKHITENTLPKFRALFPEITALQASHSTDAYEVMKQQKMAFSKNKMIMRLLLKASRQKNNICEPLLRPNIQTITEFSGLSLFSNRQKNDELYKKMMQGLEKTKHPNTSSSLFF